MKKITTKNICLCALFAALMTLGAFLKIPTPIMPITFQVTFAVLAGLLLGKKLGALSVLIYVVIGLIGIPVFTGGGGIGYVIKPSFGYLYGFIVSAFAVGAITEKDKNPSYVKLLIASVIGLIITYVFGVLHMYLVGKYITADNKGFMLILGSNVLVFLKDVVLAVLASYLAKRLIPIVRK